VGTPYSPVKLSSAGVRGDGYKWSYTGQLPPGMTFNNGVLSGTPTTAGTYDFKISIDGYSDEPKKHQSDKDRSVHAERNCEIKVGDHHPKEYPGVGENATDLQLGIYNGIGQLVKTGGYQAWGYGELYNRLVSCPASPEGVNPTYPRYYGNSATANGLTAGATAPAPDGKPFFKYPGDQAHGVCIQADVYLNPPLRHFTSTVKNVKVAFDFGQLASGSTPTPTITAAPVSPTTPHENPVVTYPAIASSNVNNNPTTGHLVKNTNPNPVSGAACPTISATFSHYECAL
jgi:hypothetical protein